MAKAVRLDKFLADAGKGTRSEVKKYIQKGQVQVNGQTVKKPEHKVLPEDLVQLQGEDVSMALEFAYYLLHKPAGYISATEDLHDRTVMELVPSDHRRKLFPVGRLDKDTEGLLLITDDGALAHELLSPARHVEKTYFVRADGKVTEEDKRRLEEGIDIGEKRLTLPARVQILDEESTSEGEERRLHVRQENLPEVYTELLLTIREGKFHQVKRMMEAVGKPVVYLKRISMGPLSLPKDLKKGECRPLTEKEIENLKKAGKSCRKSPEI
nr:pseudouridine synthase [uncultured Blautia sp.]